MPPETQKSNRNAVTIPIAIVIAGAMIAGAVYFGGSGLPSFGGPSSDEMDRDIVVEPIGANDHILGSAAASVIVVEYSDLECPFCKVFHSTMHQVVDAYGGKVAWVYRHFPIAELHPRALKEAEASECAAEQGGNTAFWKYIDEIFATTRANNTLDPAELPKIAGRLGLDVTSFNECLSSSRYSKKIADDIGKAIAAGAQGTPYSVILSDGGRKKTIINGAEPMESVRIKIDSVLK